MRSKEQRREIAWEAYKKAKDPAMEEYLKVEGKAWEKYLKVVGKAWESYWKKCVEIDAEEEEAEDDEQD